MKIILSIEQLRRERTTRTITYSNYRTEDLIADIFNDYRLISNYDKVC
jgi:hypothetical protein